MTDLEIEVSQLRETLATTNTELTRLKFKEKELEQAQVVDAYELTNAKAHTRNHIQTHVQKRT